jgi:glycine/D-amino acid oxidase-like deaminating enzyme
MGIIKCGKVKIDKMNYKVAKNNKILLKMYDAIIIGSGIIGSWTAYHLSKSGKNVLVLEQFPLGHTRGSSHGHSRNFRMTGQADLQWIQRAYDLWKMLEVSKTIANNFFYLYM